MHKKMSIGNPIGRMLCGRHKTISEDNKKMDLRVRGYENGDCWK